jgi:hypothetical protein
MFPVVIYSEKKSSVDHAQEQSGKKRMRLNLSKLYLPVTA